MSHQLFDFNEISRRALGQHWKDVSPGEQDEFVQLFTEILDRAFIANVAGPTSENVTFLGEAIDGREPSVPTLIVRDRFAAGLLLAVLTRQTSTRR